MKKVICFIEKDSKFSTGGMSPDFTNNGKSWSNIGHLKNHLKLFSKKYLYQIYKGTRVWIVEINFKTQQTTTQVYNTLKFYNEYVKKE